MARLRTACLLRVTHLSHLRLAKLCANSRRMPRYLVSTKSAYLKSILPLWCQMIWHPHMLAAIDAPIDGCFALLYCFVNAHKIGVSCLTVIYDTFYSGQGYGGESRTKVAESVCLHAGPGHGYRRRHTGWVLLSAFRKEFIEINLLI